MARGAKRARALVVCATGALALLLGSAEAQTQRTAAQAERDRRAEAQRVERLRTQANAARRDVRALDVRLIEATRRRQETEAAATAARERLTSVQREVTDETAARSRAQTSLESSIIAAAFAERRLEPRAVRAGIVARALGPAFRSEQERRATALAALRHAENSITAEQSVLADAQSAIAQERGGIVTLLAQRRTVETRLTREVSAAERRIRQLTAEARSLRELAQRVQRASARRQQGTPAPSGPSVIPAAWVAPVQGQITRNYGARAAGGSAAQGVTVRTNSGAQVVSPAAGEVAYAGSFRSYGNVLILNLDGGYALVLTGLDAINVRVGETVRAGQLVGQMTATASSAPDLYVEVRRGDQPVDPGRWLSARGLTAEAGVQAG
ncbi:MAG: peptidoglycan DD-metalloendopeptidase family protein [Hyphomonadaceae bacterium]|nr:peptidoglycan DD-metalloendopeptidase family protein [Hyphomonadaceae bacterium]